MKKYCEQALARLNAATNWAELYVNLRIEFHRLHGHKLITSTSHNAEFFINLLNCLNGAEWDKKEFKGEYEDNFRKLVEIGRNENN
jgi:hypothetical protein